MALVLNGSGSITGLSAGGLPDGCITADDLATGVGGKVLQVVSASIGLVAGSTSIPVDNTTPQSNEGTELASVSITPSSSANKILILYSYVFDRYQSSYGVSALFRGSACINSVLSANGISQMSSSYLDSPNTTSSTTYSVRYGNSAANSWWINNTSGGPRFNGSMGSFLIAMEIAA